MNNGRWCSLAWPSNHHVWTPIPRQADHLRDQEIQVQRIKQPLFPISLFICCLSEDLLQDVQEMSIWITTSSKQAYYPYYPHYPYCASFLRFGAEGEGLALLLQVLKLHSAMEVITTDIKWVKKYFYACFHEVYFPFLAHPQLISLNFIAVDICIIYWECWICTFLNLHV